MTGSLRLRSIRTLTMSLASNSKSSQLPRYGITRAAKRYLPDAWVLPRSWSKRTPGDRCIWETMTRSVPLMMKVPFIVMSAQVRDRVAPAFKDATDAIDGERRALQSFLEFARTQRHVYRIIDEAEFVEAAAYREHYETTASRIATRLIAARDKGEISNDYSDEEIEILAWGLMGANVFLGLRFAVWSSADPKQVADVTSRLLRSGLQP